MARSFHRKKSLEPNSELNVTALIDLGFALLIIFMISTPLIEKEQMLDLYVTPDGYRIDSESVNMLELEEELKRFSEMRDPPVLAIRANGDALYQSVVTLLDLLKTYKLSKINLVTRPEDE
jgi:biopolymer transport protein ExbD